MTDRFFATILSLFIFLLLSIGCTTEERDSAQNEALPSTHWFDLSIDEKPVRVQLAISPAEMSRGLMGRTDLQPDEGMLFVYRRPIQASFWMKNTPLPLDIGFFSPEGILMEVYRMYPHDETPVHSRTDQVKFALEMNQGWFSKNGLRPGAPLDREMLKDALQRRGFDPATFGL